MDGSQGALPSLTEKTVFRKDYKAPDFSIKNITLHVDIEGKNKVRVIALTSFVRRPGVDSACPLILDGSPYFELLSLKINGCLLEAEEFQQDDERLVIHSVPEQFELHVETQLNPDQNTRLEGLYASGGNLCTQCEAEGFRHITYYLDRPDILSVFTVRLEADTENYPVLLSNGNLVETGKLQNGRHYAVWHDPFPKPCYLFALVAGKLVAFSDTFKTKGGRDVALNIYVRENDIDKCAHAIQSLKRAMKWDEDVFDLEYDLDIYNIVAVSDFNMGAMENKGLNIFNTKYVLADRESATDTDFNHVEGVIAHEYFHNWTGNRVTCRDWFQLSLKEGLTVFRDQEFSADMTSRGVKRIDDVRVLRAVQFPEDAGPLAHPIRPNSYVEINNFYTATVYNKGAEVIRMMQQILGRDVFLKGVQHYLKQHDGTAATCEDFVQAMEHVSGRSLEQFRHWYRQAGTPVVTVSSERHGQDVVLQLVQNTSPTPHQQDKPAFHIPIVMGWFDAHGKSLVLKADAVTGCSIANSADDGSLLIELTEMQGEVRFHDVPKGAVASLHRNFSAPISLVADQSPEILAFLLSHETDAYARWHAGQELFSTFILDLARGVTPADETLTRIENAVQDLISHAHSDVALQAELLTLPSETYLAQKMRPYDAQALHQAREFLYGHIAKTFSRDILALYKTLETPAALNGQDGAGARRLRNSLLGYIAMTATAEAEAISFNHFTSATNMTDQFAALMVFVHCDWTSRENVIRSFYQQWHDNDLVIDKWFTAQALSKRKDALDVVRELSRHEAFSFKNPNRLRSLILSFATNNLVAFHKEDGSAYNFYAEIILQVDKVNPQLAARLIAPLARWEMLVPSCQEQLKLVLNRLFEYQALSKDARELVKKSLQE